MVADPDRIQTADRGRTFLRSERNGAVFGFIEQQEDHPRRFAQDAADPRQPVGEIEQFRRGTVDPREVEIDPERLIHVQNGLPRLLLLQFFRFFG